MNPVLHRELLRRWRGNRAPLVLTMFLAALGLLMVAFHEIGKGVLEQQAQWAGAQVAFLRPSLGRFMVEAVLATLLGLVLVAAPGFAAGQIAGERERGTFPLLQATLMTPLQIVMGKLWASTAWVGLLVIAALPLVTIAAVFGGVEWLDVVLGLATVLVIGLAVGAMALGVSSITRRTTAAVVITYALVLLLMLGTGLVAVLMTVTRQQPDGSLWALQAHPFTALAGAVNASEFNGNFGLPSPLTPFAYALALPDQGAFFQAGPVVDVSRSWEWLQSLGVLVVFGVLGLVVAVQRVQLDRAPRTPLGRFREPRSRVRRTADG